MTCWGIVSSVHGAIVNLWVGAEVLRGVEVDTQKICQHVDLESSSTSGIGLFFSNMQ